MERKEGQEEKPWGYADTEDDLRKEVAGMMAGWGEIQRHEDKLQTGIPDLSFAARTPDGEGVDGWIELKVLKKFLWENRPLSIPKLTAKQRKWLKSRGSTGGGKCFVLVRIGRHAGRSGDWILLKWSALDSMADMPTSRLAARPDVHWWIRKPLVDQWRKALTE